MMPLYKVFARTLLALKNCEKNGNKEWVDKHREKLEELAQEYMPSGSGFDAGTKFYIYISSPNHLIFHTSFHHMDEHGFYTGWTKHQVYVKPSLAYGFDLEVIGENLNDIHEYIHEVFAECLRKEVEES